MHTINNLIMNIYKLQYEDKESAITDLIDKKVIDKNNNYINGTQAVVEVGKIVLVEGVYDEKNNLITEPVFLNGYHYDIMVLDEIDFGNADITDLIDNPKHSFAT